VVTGERSPVEISVVGDSVSEGAELAVLKSPTSSVERSVALGVLSVSEGSTVEPPVVGSSVGAAVGVKTITVPVPEPSVGVKVRVVGSGPG